MPNAMMYLSKKHGLAGENEEEYDKARRVLLAMNDCIEKAIDAYHPKHPNKSYEKQKEEAKVTINTFMEEGIPVYMKDFEDCLRDHWDGQYYMVSK